MTNSDGSDPCVHGSLLGDKSTRVNGGNRTESLDLHLNISLSTIHRPSFGEAFHVLKPRCGWENPETRQSRTRRH